MPEGKGTNELLLLLFWVKVDEMKEKEDEGEDEQLVNGEVVIREGWCG